MLIRWLSLLAFSAIGAAFLSAAHSMEDPSNHQCLSLASLHVAASRISLPTRGAWISSVAMTEPGDANGSFCEVVGEIRPHDLRASPIRFQINLPTHWNRKAIHFGGGGYDGTLVNAMSGQFLGEHDAHPIALEYVTFGSDSGHQTPASDPNPAAFSLDSEKLLNFGGAQLKKVHDVALFVVRRYYGATPRRIYFYGNSQGGHEGLTVAQRWPQDYDGVVAIHPAYDLTAIQLSGLHLGQVLYGAPGAWISPQKLSFLASSIMRTCDELDGLKDGVIANTEACHTAFSVDSLRCEGGRDTGEECLSDAQIGTIHVFDSAISFGFGLQGGVTGFARWPLLDGAFAYFTRFGLGARPIPDNPPGPRDAFIYFMADQLVRFTVMQDPQYNSMRFEPGKHIAQLVRLSNAVDASSSNLDAFRLRGGKLLLMHGTVDMAIPPGNTIAYYKSLEQRYGTAALRSFARFYVAPGFGHGDGAFLVSWDSLSALDAWVDQGSEPSIQIVTDMSATSSGRSRPLCEYPAWPKYLGAGDPSRASSFRCVNEP
jgi:pimeloyl-ACP methyl ester carboxylesterase